MKRRFDYSQPTVEMLGRFQPWHKGHTELFRHALSITGQVCIMLRDVGGKEAGVEGQDDNPFPTAEIARMIRRSLREEGFRHGREYIILRVPNIIDISYGRDVGYTFTEHDLGEEMHRISASEIRAKLRRRGKLAAMTN
jgi:nicotinamide mononucleotide adenylyltransferase